MTIENDDDLQMLLRIGRICGEAVQVMLAAVEPGITTADLDAIGAAFLRQHGARSAPILAYEFPGHTCISINDEAAHGIPGPRQIQPGDLVNIDVSAELEGYWADTAASLIVPPVPPQAERLCRFTRRALDEAIKVVRAGQPLNLIGKAVERMARKGRYAVIRELPGHGIGRYIHEKPRVFNFYHRKDKTVMHEGMVFTIEPFFSAGSGHIYTEDDGWTLRTVDHSLSAQYEHTLIVTADGPILATAVD